MIWQLQTAKQKFSELVERALTEGPQIVTRRGKPAVVVVEVEEFRRLQEDGSEFKRFLREAPDFTLLEIERSAATGRTVDL
jgi:prevent-host-death family protein